MELPVQFDLSRIGFVNAADTLVPIVPGVVLLVGAGTIWPEMAARFFTITYLGYNTKLALACLVGYGGGLVAYALTSLITGLLGFVPGQWLTQRYAGKHFPDTSQNLVFRKAAMVFLGAALQPATVDPRIPEPVYDAEVKRLQELQDDSARQQLERWDLRQRFLILNEVEWIRWHKVLRACFPGKPVKPYVGLYVVRASASAAVATLVLLGVEHGGHPLVAGISWTALGMGIANEFFLAAQMVSHDPDAAQLTAAVLRATKGLPPSNE